MRIYIDVKQCAVRKWNPHPKTVEYALVHVCHILSYTVRMLREELQHLQEQGSYVGEVVKPMDKKKVGFLPIL